MIRCLGLRLWMRKLERFPKTAAELGPYRDILEFIEDNCSHDHGNPIGTIKGEFTLHVTRLRGYLDRGVHEGYLDVIKIKNHMYWSWGYRQDLPDIGALTQRKELKRVQSLNNKDGGAQIGLSYSEKRTGQRLLKPYDGG